MKENTTRRIKITIGNVTATALLNETRTAKAVWHVLPIKDFASVWGCEVYFDVPIDVPEEKSVPTVSMGEIGYWPPGSAFCIFFGPTPESEGDEIRPASPVTIIGKVEGDPTVFAEVKPEDPVLIEKA